MFHPFSLCSAWIVLSSFSPRSASAEEGRDDAGISASAPGPTGRVWGAYLGQFRLGDRLATSLEAHFATGAFLLSRYSLEFFFQPELRFSLGQSFLSLPTEGRAEFRRSEIRPHLQLFGSAGLPFGLSFSARFRYELRFRKRLEQGELTYGFSRVDRLRLASTLRRDLFPLAGTSDKPVYLSLGNEVLIQLDEGAGTVGWDQHRVLLALGLPWGSSLTFQLGFMHRWLAASSSSGAREDHVFALWFLHQLDLRPQREVRLPQVRTKGRELVEPDPD